MVKYIKNIIKSYRYKILPHTREKDRIKRLYPKYEDAVKKELDIVMYCTLCEKRLQNPCSKKEYPYPKCNKCKECIRTVKKNTAIPLLIIFCLIVVVNILGGKWRLVSIPIGIVIALLLVHSINRNGDGIY